MAMSQPRMRTKTFQSTPPREGVTRVAEFNAAIDAVSIHMTCPTDGGRGASLIDWAAIDTKGTIYGRQEYTTETLQ